MKLLLDQNLSPRLVALLAGSYPDIAHVRDFGLAMADDALVWEYAKTNGFAIVSKDADFHQKCFLLGHPPKVVWIRLGNCSTADVLRLLKDRRDHVEEFGAHEVAAFLILP